ncbi:hypothetical protein KDL44_06815 [bacterium]|nr:hypothetical protein [bacterium]
MGGRGDKWKTAGNRRKWWLIAALLLLATALGLQLWITRVVPSGDPLYDRYQAAWLARKRWSVGLAILPLSSTPGPQGLYCGIDDAILAGWEDEFGDDPRYWELRFFNEAALRGALPLRLRAPDEPEDPQSYRSAPAVRHLARAQELGVADGHLLDLLEPYRYASLFRHHAYRIEQAGSREATVAANRAFEQAELEQLDSAIEASPGSAWPCYEKFLALNSYGVDSELVELLERGNGLPCERRTPFPLSLLESRTAGGNIGNHILAGSILEVQQHLVFGNWNTLELKTVMKELVVASPDTGLERSMDAVYQMSLREGVADDAFAPALAYVALQLTLVNAGDGLDATGRQQLLYQVGLVDALQAGRLQWQELARHEHPDAWYETMIGWLDDYPESKVSFSRQEFKPLSWSGRGNGSFDEPERSRLQRWNWQCPLHRYPALSRLYLAQHSYHEQHIEPYFGKLRGYHIGRYDERNYHQGIDP